MKYTSALLMAGIAMLAACKKDGKDSDGTPSIAGKSKQQVFMMQKWFLTNFRDSSLASDVDYIESCAQDDTYEFKSTSLYTQDRMGTVCSGGEPATENYPWSMASADAGSVTIFSKTYTIESMSGDKIVLSREFPATGGYGKQTVIFSRKR